LPPLTVSNSGSGGLVIVIRPLATVGIAGWPTWLVRIVATAPTKGRHALATQRVGIAHQAGNFLGDVSRKGHGNLGT